MVAVVGSLLFLAALLFATVRFVQWLRGTGPFDRNPLRSPKVGAQRRALLEEIAAGRSEREDAPGEAADLNDAWMAGEAFGPPEAGADDRRR